MNLYKKGNPEGFPDVLDQTLLVAVEARAGLGNSFVDTKIATTEVLAVKLADGSDCSRIVFHLYETKALGAAGLAVNDDVCTQYGAVLCEQVAKFLFAGVVTHVTNIDFLCHSKHPSQAIACTIEYLLFLAQSRTFNLSASGFSEERIHTKIG